MGEVIVLPTKSEKISYIYTLRSTDKISTKVIEFDDKYILYNESDGAGHGGIAISKITFEENEAFSDLINYLEAVLHIKKEELEILYSD